MWKKNQYHECTTYKSSDISFFAMAAVRKQLAFVCKKGFIKTLQNLQENSFARGSFLVRFQASICNSK